MLKLIGTLILLTGVILVFTKNNPKIGTPLVIVGIIIGGSGIFTQ